MTEQELKTSNMCEAYKGKQKRNRFVFLLLEQMSGKAIKLNCVRKKKIGVGYFPAPFK